MRTRTTSGEGPRDRARSGACPSFDLKLVTRLQTHVWSLPAILGRVLLSEYAAAVAIFIVTEAVALVLRYQLDLISSSIIVLFGVLVSATVLGSRPSLLTAALTAIAYDYFTIPPDNSFEIRSLSDVIVLTTFPVVALLIGGLAERAHDSAVRAPTIVRTSEESFIEPADAVNSPEVLPTAASRSEFEALTKTEKLRSALLSCVSHDFRTPLAVILASASSLRTLSAEMSADVREDLLAAIQEEAERLNRFVTNLLHMARLESGVVEPRRATVDIAAVIQRTAQRFDRGRWQGRLTTALEGRNLLVEGDPILLAWISQTRGVHREQESEIIHLPQRVIGFFSP